MEIPWRDGECQDLSEKLRDGDHSKCYRRHRPLFIESVGRMLTYHPQTEALLQWFEMGGSSNAIMNTAGTDGGIQLSRGTASTLSPDLCHNNNQCVLEYGGSRN